MLCFYRKARRLDFKDRDDVLNVFITAPDEDRIQRIMETEDVTQTQAEKLMVQIDKMRNNYYSYFTDRKWQHTKDRDIIVNSSLLGIEGTVGMLEYIVNASNWVRIRKVVKCANETALQNIVRKIIQP